MSFLVAEPKLVTAAATRVVYGRDGSVKKGKGNADQVGQSQYLLVSKVEIKPMGSVVMPAETASTQVYEAMAAAVMRQAQR